MPHMQKLVLQRPAPKARQNQGLTSRLADEKVARVLGAGFRYYFHEWRNRFHIGDAGTRKQRTKPFFSPKIGLSSRAVWV